MIWSDTNRFSQSGYSASTIFPKRENYQSEELFNEDYTRAQLREENHQEWLFDLQEELRQEQYCIDHPEYCEEEDYYAWLYTKDIQIN